MFLTLSWLLSPWQSIVSSKAADYISQDSCPVMLMAIAEVRNQWEMCKVEMKQKLRFSELQAGHWWVTVLGPFLPCCLQPSLRCGAPFVNSRISCNCCSIWFLPAAFRNFRSSVPPHWWKPWFQHETPHSHDSCSSFVFPTKPSLISTFREKFEHSFW